MSARIPYRVFARCDLNCYHLIAEVDAVTREDAVEQVRREFPDRELEARSVDEVSRI